MSSLVKTLEQLSQENNPILRATATLEALKIAGQTGELDNLAPVLPYIFNLRGKPFTLKNHFVWESLFNLETPRSRTIKCGRQIGKSESTAVQLCIYSILNSYFNTLLVAPRYEQSRLVSNDKVQKFIDESPVMQHFVRSYLPMNITQKAFSNGSNQYYSYALLDAERIRSKTASAVFIDEAQDIDNDFLPVIFEVMSAQTFTAKQFTGTPKTFDNTLEIQWESSSQAEWCVPCPACNYLNVCAGDQDLIKMIIPQGLSCAKCGRLVDSEWGWWEHRFPERRDRHEGYHAPQMIFPVHFRYNPDEPSHDHERKMNPKWTDIILAQEEMAPYRFHNEKLGESFESADELISKSALIDNSTLGYNNTEAEALEQRKKGYNVVTMGIDWGGGGEDGLSRTAIVIMGHKANGKSDVLYMYRINHAMDHMDEVALIMRLFDQFKCAYLAHDYCGAGEVRETLMVQAGFPPDKMIPIAYVGHVDKDIVKFVPASDDAVRPYLRVSKVKSLAILCALINKGHFKFPKFESWSVKPHDYTTQFLALVQEKRDGGKGGASYFIQRKKGRPDDIAMATNYCALAFWYTQQIFPDIAKLSGMVSY